nr:MAG TPA: hypothetical protein [Caudoviricetes sp.]
MPSAVSGYSVRLSPGLWKSWQGCQPRRAGASRAPSTSFSLHSRSFGSKDFAWLSPVVCRCPLGCFPCR